MDFFQVTPRVSVIVTVYNILPKYLEEALDSLHTQVLDKALFEVILVDDASNDPETRSFVDALQRTGKWKSLPVKVVLREENGWVVAARRDGVELSRGEYVCFFDGDDLLAPDFLQKSMLVLDAHPGAGWTYPNVQKFWYLDQFDYAPDFNARKLYWGNYCVVTSMFRRSVWDRLKGMRDFRVSSELNWFEDWDFFIRAMTKGWYGVPLRDTTFYYRQHIKSTITRNRMGLLLTNYLVYRKNLFAWFTVKRAQKQYGLEINEANGRSCGWFSLRNMLDRIAGKILSRFFEKPYRYFPMGLFLKSIVNPKGFIETSLKEKVFPTKAELLCGFSEKPHLKKHFPMPEGDTSLRSSVLFAHYWWKMGGAENVLLDWMKSYRSFEGSRIIDLAVTADYDSRYLKEEFADLSDEQYTINRLSTNALSTLKLCWGIIQRERPRVVYNMSNPYFYVLAPFIKEAYPDMQIVDLLHCEDHQDSAWFGAAFDYQSSLDRRIVISDFWKQVLIEKYSEKAEKIDVLMNALDLDRFNPETHDRESLLEVHDINPKKRVIGFLGRFHQQKNPMVFLKLAEEMHADERYHFVVVGKGPMEKELLKEIGALSNVTYVGYSKDPARFYAMFDVAVFPSVYEGYPLVGMEAAAMNVPIIATKVAGFREQIKEGNFGLLYQQETLEKDPRKLKALLTERYEELIRLGSRGRHFIEQYHDFEKQTLLYKAFFKRLLAVESKPRSLRSSAPDSVSASIQVSV